MEHVGEHLGVTSSAGLQILLLAVAGVYALGACADVLLAPGEGLYAGADSAALCLIATTLGALHHRRPYSPRARLHIAGAVALLCTVTAVRELLDVEVAAYVSFVVLVLVGGGAALPSRPWLLGCCLAAAGGVGLGALTGRLEQEAPLQLVIVGFGAIVALLLQLLMNRGRHRVQALTDLLAAQARVDSLTGLLNRRGFEAGLEQLVSSLDATTPVIVLCLDLDGFKTVNDRLGHGVGDDVLSTVGERLQEALGAEALICRSGGDEFLAVRVEQEALTSSTSAVELTDHLARQLTGEVADVRWSVSVGLATGPVAALPTLLHTADQQMYASKQRAYLSADGPRRRISLVPGP